MQQQELKSCPFCGGKPQLINAYGIRCVGCHAEIDNQSTVKGAIFAWNTRAHRPAPEVGSWQPIETAPKDSDRGIIARKGYFVFWTDWDDEANVWFTQNRFYEGSLHAKKYDGDSKWKPTHWMLMLPLPAKPSP